MKQARADGAKTDLGVVSRRSLVGGLLAGGAASLAPSLAFGQDVGRAAPEVIVPGSDTIGIVDWRVDPFGRIITQVFVNGQGPFRFFVDTGANRCALSARLAARVGAIPAGVANVNGISGVQPAPMVTVDNLRCGAFELRGATVPILSDELILPADGMLGMDRFAGLRLEFDNLSRTMVVKRSGRGSWDPTFSMPADIRFGQLVSAKAKIGTATVTVVFDTGAELGLANEAMRRLLDRPAPEMQRMRLTNAAAPIFVQDSVLIPRIKLPNCEFKNIGAYVGDFHIFQIWNLIDTPALLLGMSALGVVDRFAIDYGQREMQFMPKAELMSARVLMR
jgi:predicted aspartyl protease